MSTIDSTTAGAPDWPRVIPVSELSDLFAIHRVTPGPSCPVIGLAPSAATPAAAPDAELASALWAIAAPSRIVQLTNYGADEATAAVFLQREDVLVRFARHNDSVVISRPGGRSEFARDLTGLLAAPPTATGEDFVITRRLLMAIAALHEAGAERHMVLDRVTAAEAIAPAVVDGINPGEVLDRLAPLGVLADGDAGLTLTPDWSEAYGHLLGTDRVLLEVTEIASRCG
jgi:hypothetical protein